jgi:hypothetical protein
MRRASILILIFIFIVPVACSVKNPSPGGLPTMPVQQVSTTQSPTPQDTFWTKVWVDEPTPPLNSRIIVFGSLNRNGVYMGGIMMQATWPDETHERGVPNCISLVNYGSGKCIIDVSRFPPGKYVPVTITLNYRGMVFTAQTGFTPQEP